MSNYDYDLFVIGGGSGGVRAARIAAGYGARVGLAEEYRLGGTCVIRGCVPKKLFVYASRYADEFEDAAGYGWSVGSTKFDWPSLVAAKDKEISRLEGLYGGTLERAGVTVFGERAEFVDAHTLRLKPSGRTVTADKVLIATGGTPFVDSKLEGYELGITSNEAFHLKRLPERIVIYGGGYIAIEFAGIFAGLGVDTTIVYRGDKILRGFDDDLRDGLTTAYTKRGIKLVLGRVFTKLEKVNGRLVGHLDDGSTLEADEIMLAIGRNPNVVGLGLDAISVERGWNGSIVVDDEQRTNVENIFAVGDVCDRFNLTPVAIAEGHAFADAQFGNNARLVSYEMIPTAVFSTPEIGTVGLGECDARERCAKLDVYKSEFRPMKATLSGRDEKMLMKLLVDGESGRVVGCHVIGEGAAEIVQMAAIALRIGVTKAQFDQTMALHPSAAEEFVTMRQKWQPVAAAAE
ncbi:NADPH-glutathione reductase [Filomicrobium insigne]|uniref:Glutathione reductase n=1 Tax=Filomicrobium insigne TaxID=418854 RepID=A0A1H0T7V4_9HYPH|nr:glutathione-disulfide reductase [Filomicrobium insigne]SDP50133.1 NADPH-glutathione reductase [Filomicrobium insigne]